MTANHGAMTIAKCAATFLVAGLLCVGCMPIDITKTIKINTDTEIFKTAPGTPIPDDFTLKPIDVCEEVPEEYRDVEQLIPNLLAQVGMESYAQYISIEKLEIVKVALEIAEGGGSFEGITEVSGTINGEYALVATPGNGISPTEIVLEPESPIDVIATLKDCPLVTGAIKGIVPLDPPKHWVNVVTVHLKAKIGLS